MLFLWLVKRDVLRDNGPEFDATYGFVIAAMNEVEARRYAASYREDTDDNRHRDEDSNLWFAPTTTCRKIGIATTTDTIMGVILEDHQGG